MDVLLHTFFTRKRVHSITGIVVVFIPHILSISNSRSLYFKSFFVVIIVFSHSVGNDISISWQVLLFYPSLLCQVSWLSFLCQFRLARPDLDLELQ